MPAYELILPESLFRAGESRLRKELQQALSRLQRKGDREAAARLKTAVEQHLQRLPHSGALDMLPDYFSYFYGEGASLLDYLPENMALLLDELALAESGEKLQRELTTTAAIFFCREAVAGSDGDPSGNPGTSQPERPSPGCFYPFPGLPEWLPATRECRIEARAASFITASGSCWPIITTGSGKATGLFSYRSRERGEGLIKALQEHDLPCTVPLDRAWSGDAARPVQMVTASWSRATSSPLQLAILTEQNLLPSQRKRRRMVRRKA